MSPMTIPPTMTSSPGGSNACAEIPWAVAAARKLCEAAVQSFRLNVSQAGPRHKGHTSGHVALSVRNESGKFEHHGPATGKQHLFNQGQGDQIRVLFTILLDILRQYHGRMTRVPAAAVQVGKFHGSNCTQLCKICPNWPQADATQQRQASNTLAPSLRQPQSHLCFPVLVCFRPSKTTAWRSMFSGPSIVSAARGPPSQGKRWLDHDMVAAARCGISCLARVDILQQAVEKNIYSQN